MATTTFSTEQTQNADTIISVGKSLGATPRDIQVALMTALQESGLQNIDYGDRDSLGLFQQRAAWAPASDRMSPAQSAYMFFKGGQGGQRGLLDFQNRDSMSLTQAAQAVQVSAFPDAYAKWSTQAQALLGSTTATTPTTPTPGTTPSATPTPDQSQQPPGAAAVSAPGAGLAAAPGSQAVIPEGVADPFATPKGTVDPNAAPTGPTQTSTMMSYEDFNNMFPDAGSTQMFTGALGGSSNARRTDTVTTAMSYLGTPYVWGGNDRSGVDCSGLVQQVYKSMGIDLPRLSSDQIRAGQATPYSQLKPGDLIGWDENSRNNGADHIAIYAGNGQIVEAPRPGLNVRVRALSAQEIKTALGAHFAQLG